jgi:hypothetical protein
MGNFGQKNSTSTAQQQLPDYLQSAYQGIVGNAQGAASTPYQGYTGGFTQDQQTAFGNIGRMAGSSDPAFLNASTALSGATAPAYTGVANYMSPYNQSVIDATQNQFNLQNAQQQQGVIGNAIAKGAMGGNRVGVAQAQLAGQQQTAQAPVIAGLYNQNYAQALAAAQNQQRVGLDAAAGYGNLGQTQMQTGLAQAGAQLGAGTQQQQFDYQQYLNKLAFPYQQQSWLASIAGGLGPSAGGTTSESKPQGNIFSQLLGAGLGIASLFNEGGRVHAAGGGVMSGMPYANDNGQFGSYMGQSGVVPYANDNGMFGSYIPQVASMGGHGGGFPTISASGQEDDPFAVTKDQMKAGASNIKGWLTPHKELHAGFNLEHGGVVGSHYARGGDVGRYGYAGGGRPLQPMGSSPLIGDTFAGLGLSQDDVLNIALKKRAEDDARRAAVQAAPTIDTTDVIDGNNLGLGMGNVSSEPPSGMAYADTPDNRGLNGAPMSGLRSVGAPPAPSGVAGDVPFSTGDQFTTTPAPGYSENVGDAWKSLTTGKGLNLSPDMRQSLLAAGMGMMASKSPFALAGIGEGGLTGIEAWNARQKLESELAAQRASNASTGADIALKLEQAGLTGAEAGRTTQATAIDRWNFTPSMAGMVIQDKVSPTGSFVIPYAELDGWAQKNGIDPSQLPTQDAAMANAQPTMTDEGVRFHVPVPKDAKPSGMGWTPTGQGILASQSTSTLEDARSANTAAQDASLQLAAMKNAASNLPNTGLLAPGQWAEARGSIAKSLNTLASIAGMKLPFDPNAVASIEEMNKLTTQFGFSLAKTTGSDVASAVISQGIGAVPGIENTPQGFKAITGLIQASLNRTKDYYDFLNRWVDATGGDVTGASEAFNQAAPPTAYATSAMLSTAVVPKTQSDIDNAPPGTLFNVNGKLMVK